jgi:hypothetical protein
MFSPTPVAYGLGAVAGVYGMYRGLNIASNGSPENALSNPIGSLIGLVGGAVAVGMSIKSVRDHRKKDKSIKAENPTQEPNNTETASISRGEKPDTSTDKKPADTTSAFNESSKGDGKSGGNATTAAAPVDVTPPKQPPKTPNSKLGQ